jgi:3'-5' exoribonuclease
MNSVARERMTSQTADSFTDKIFALDNRRFYKGIPEGPANGPSFPTSS